MRACMLMSVGMGCMEKCFERIPHRRISGLWACQFWVRKWAFRRSSLSSKNFYFCQINWRKSSASHFFAAPLWSDARIYGCFYSIVVWMHTDMVKWKFLQLYDVMCDGSGYHVVSCRESMFIYIVSVGRICRTFGLHYALASSASQSPFFPRNRMCERLAPEICAACVRTWFHGLWYFINTIIANFSPPIRPSQFRFTHVRHFDMKHVYTMHEII